MYVTTTTEAWIDCITRLLLIQCNHLITENKTTANTVFGNKYPNVAVSVHI